MYYPIEKEIMRGDVYFADLDPSIGSEQHGCRPVVIIQNNVGNRYCPTVIVAPLTTIIKKTNMPTHVIVENIGKKRESLVLLEQIRTLDKSRLDNCIDHLDDETMTRIDKALCVSLGLAGTEAENEMELCLCPTCASQFYNSPNHFIRRVDPFQKYKDICTYCNYRYGFDYLITIKDNNGGN